MSGIGASARDGAVVELDGGSVRVHGHLGLMAVPGGVRPIRLPEARWRDFPPAGELLRAQVSTAAGVRIRFTTRADEVRLRVRCTRIRFDELPGPRNTFVAEVDGVDLPPVAAPVDVVRRIPPSGDAAEETAVGSGDPSVVVLRGLGHGPSTVTVWLPQGMLVDLVGVTAEEPVRAADPLGLPRWIHHGSPSAIAWRPRIRRARGPSSPRGRRDSTSWAWVSAASACSTRSSRTPSPTSPPT